MPYATSAPWGPGQVVYIVAHIAGISGNSQTVSMSTPAGFTTVATAGGMQTAGPYQTYVWRALSATASSTNGATAAFTANSFGAGGTSAGKADWVANSVTIIGIKAEPKAAGIVTQNTPESVFVVPATPGGNASSACLVFIGACLSTSSGSTYFFREADVMGGLTQRVMTTNRRPGAATSLFLTGSGDKTFDTQAALVVRQVGQIILDPLTVAATHPGAPITGTARLAGRGVKFVAIRKSHPGGALTGYPRLLARGIKVVPPRKAHPGAPITGFAKPAARRGVKVITEIPKHYGTLAGYAKITGRGVARRKPPHFRNTSKAAADAATSLVLQIPADTRPTDLLLLTATWASPSTLVVPAGWTPASAGPVDGTATQAVLTRSAGYGDAGTYVTVAITGAATQMAGLLAVYTPSVIDQVTVTTQASSSTRVLFGPATEDPGTLRAALLAARATSTTGEQISFTKPIFVVDGAFAATPRTQAENDRGHSLGVAGADYTGTTSLTGMLTAVVPVLARAWVGDLEGIEYHETHLTGTGRLGGGHGIKHATDGTNQRARISGRDDGRGSAGTGRHTDIGVHAAHLRYTGYASLTGGPGIVHDTFHGVRVVMQARLTASGSGTHSNGYAGTITGGARLRDRRGSQQMSGSGTPLTAQITLAGHGRRVVRHPGTRITGWARLLATGTTRVTVLKGFFGITEPNEHHGAHTDIGLSEIITGEARLTVHRGTVQAYIDERYTQIRGLFTGHGRGYAGPPHLSSPGGRITGIGIVTAIGVHPREPEDLDVPITLGQPSISGDRSNDVEDFELEIEPGLPRVLLTTA